MCPMPRTHLCTTSTQTAIQQTVPVQTASMLFTSSKLCRNSRVRKVQLQMHFILLPSAYEYREGNTAVAIGNMRTNRDL